MAEVACIGIVVLDAIGKPIDSFPEKGKLVMFDKLSVCTGGCATNAANALAIMGFDVAVIGKLGDDPLAEIVKNEVARYGVDTSGIVLDSDVNTSFTFAAVSSDSERSFFHTPGANSTFTAEDVDFSIIEAAKVVLLAGVGVMSRFDGAGTAAVLERAKRMGKTTVLDTCMGRNLRERFELLTSGFEHLDYFVPSYEEAKMIAGEDDPDRLIDIYLDRGVANVVLKMGARGVYACIGGERWEVPSYVVQAEDTLGAGDSWAAGFCAGLVKGWPIRECLRFGNAVAAHCVQSVGAVSGIREFETIRAFQKTAKVTG